MMLTCKKNNFNNRIITNTSTSSLVEGEDGPEKPSNSISSKKIKKKDKKDNPIYLFIKIKINTSRLDLRTKYTDKNTGDTFITSSSTLFFLKHIILTKHAQERIKERLDPKLNDFHKLLRKLNISGRHFQQLFDSEPNTPRAYYAIKLPKIKVKNTQQDTGTLEIVRGGLLIVRKKGNVLTVITLRPGLKPGTKYQDKIVELKY